MPTVVGDCGGDNTRQEGAIAVDRPRSRSLALELGSAVACVRGRMSEPILKRASSTDEGSENWSRLHTLTFQQSEYGRLELIVRANRLIDRYGLNPVSALGNTPLHFACTVSYRPLLAMHLVDRGADCAVRNSHGQSPMHVAAAHMPAQVIVAMVSKRSTRVNMRDQDGSAPLHWAVQQSPFRTKVVRVLLEAGADASVADASGDTAVHHAARDGDIELFDLLMQFVHEPVFNMRGLAPMHAAVEMDEAEFVEAFIGKYGAEGLPVSSKNGSTVLHIAARNGCFATAAALVRLVPALVNALDRHDQTPFTVAVANRNLRVAQLLVDNGAEPAAKCAALLQYVRDAMPLKKEGNSWP